MRLVVVVEPLGGGAGENLADSSWSGVVVRGVSAVETAFDSPSLCSSSSTPNDNFPFATAFRFFFGGGPWGFESLCFDHQSPI